MKKGEINETIGRRLGTLTDHAFENLGYCPICRQYKCENKRCVRVDYTRDREVLAAAESEVYGISSVMTIYRTEHHEVTVELIIPGETRTYRARHATEPEARAEAVAAFIKHQEQANENG